MSLEHISKSTYIFTEILSFLTYTEQLRSQLICRKFHLTIVPLTLPTCSIRSAAHAAPPTKLYQYASGHMMQRDL